MCKGEIHAGGVTTKVEGSLGEERNENVNSKDIVHTSEWNASKKCQYAIFQPPQVTEFKCLGSTLQSKCNT